MHGKPTILSKEQENKICSLYRDEKRSLLQIIRQFKIGEIKLRKILQENKVEIDSNRRASKKINFTAERVEYILTQYKQTKKSARELAEEIGCSRSVIEKYLHKNKIQIKNQEFYHGNSLQEADEQEMAALYLAGAGIVKIANIFKIGKPKVKKILIKLGIKYKQRRCLTSGDEEKIISDYLSSDDTQDKIAQKHEIDARTVFEILKRHNVSRRRSKQKIRKIDRRSLFEKLVAKYGPIQAEIKYLECKENMRRAKQKRNQNNPQLPHHGSGVGIRTSYRGARFRSLTELTFFVKEIENLNLQWETGEQEKFRIPYCFGGKKRNYFPDFFLNNSTVIEVKPLKKQSDPIVQAKAAAAVEFCISRGLTYKMVDYKTDFKLIRSLYEGQQIIPYNEKDKFRLEKALYRNCKKNAEI